MDVQSAVDVDIAPGQTVLVPTGLKFAIPEGYEIQVRPRSGLSLRTALRLPNSPGTIDSGYRGELGIIVSNTAIPSPAGCADGAQSPGEGVEPGCVRGEGTEPGCARSEGNEPSCGQSGGDKPNSGRGDGTEPNSGRRDATEPSGVRSDGTEPNSGRGDGTETSRVRSEGNEPDSGRGDGVEPSCGRAPDDIAAALDSRLRAATLESQKSAERRAGGYPVCPLDGPYADGACAYRIRRGDRIAQIVLKAVPAMEFAEVRSVDEIGESRGGGFGSTGIREK
jgi:dUTPase